jgi:hypothetical protein
MFKFFWILINLLFVNYLTPPFPKGSLRENDGAKHIPNDYLSSKIFLNY